MELNQLTNIPLTKARLAKELGITRQSINTWINRGDLVFDDSEKMSVDEFNRQLGDKLHPTSKIRTEKYSPIFSNVEENKSEDVELDYHAARTIREIAEARSAEFKLNVMKGDYVEREQVDKVIFERARQFRDGLITLSRRIAPDLASINDVKQIESLLNKEHRLILEQFSKLPVIDK
jgi:hypothetical protein